MSRNAKTSLENYLSIDHRCGPGMPEEFSHRFNLPALPGGKLVELKTLTCGHCTTQVILNPERKRERNYCYQCDGYICDGCAAIMREPDYVHIPWKAVVHLVQDGKAILLPGSTHGRPKLLFLAVKE